MMDNNKRRDALRAYLAEVARDLAQRAMIRKSAGQTIEQIVLAEPDAVLRAVSHDLKTVFKEAGTNALARTGMAIFGALFGG